MMCCTKKEWSGKMKSSVLNGIIQRLEAMTHTESEIEVRRFEVEGSERCQVTYIKESDMFELTETGASAFQYDDIDLVAIEIYELLG